MPSCTKPDVSPLGNSGTYRSSDMYFEEYIFPAISLRLAGGPAAEHCCQSILPNAHFGWNLSLFKTDSEHE